MNLIVVGASHRSAPVALLERLSLLTGPQPLTGAHVAEAVLLKTCNRVEIYAAVPAFHAGLTQIGEVLAQVTGLPADELARNLYVHHGIDAVRHVLRVSAGLESMVAGEAQILGQLRDAYQQASEVDTVGRTLHELMQQALRVGKRAHAETGIDQAPRTLVAAALDQAALAFTTATPSPTPLSTPLTDPPSPAPVDMAELRDGPVAAFPAPHDAAEVEGGAVSGSAMPHDAVEAGDGPAAALPAPHDAAEALGGAFSASARSHGSAEVEGGAVSVLPTPREAGDGSASGSACLFATPGGAVDKRRWVIVGAGAMGALARAELTRRGAQSITMVNRSEREGSRPLSDLAELLGEADVIVTATASMAPVITVAMVRAVGKPITLIDLAMPRDVEVGVGELPGVKLIDIEHLSAVLPDHSMELGEVERIVASEVDAFGSWLREGEVAPTVAALRSKADEVVGAELKRLAQRLPELSADQRDEVSHAVHRVVQRLLHQPTVRVRQLAAEPGGEAYTQLVRDLFDLHPQSVTVAEIPEVAE